MLEHLDGYHVAAQVRFIRQVRKGTILIVEGETDARVLDRFIDSTSCDFEVGFGKKNVINALDLLEDEGFPGVVAIVDADFDRLLGKTYRLENLRLTDSHDLDLTIFVTSALERYIAEHADKYLFKKQFTADISTVRTRVINASLPLAYCRFTSEHKNIDLYFKDLKHDKFVNLDDLSTDSDQLVAELVARSSTKCTAASLKTYIETEAAENHDPYQLANGHDVAAIISAPQASC
jgi:Protein of unknown function (DUF4435)